ncbi:MAG TPA: energy transducer TonB [Pyrinomonadaceae bacterium]|nr:energy transducer TonB [Pyrinomonadaceae bacterium]
MNIALTFRRLLGLLIVTLTFLAAQAPAALAQIAKLEAKLKSQYTEIEQEIASPPMGTDPTTYRLVLRAWQDRLANRFADAGTTVEEILKLHPANSEFWRERLETLTLYSQPISSPDQRTIFGDGEVQKRARVVDAPAAIYTPEARANKTKGDVRLRVVLASDGTVRNVFAIKSLSHGLTESAMEAARQIKFQPAIRNGVPAAQFATFVYEFKKDNAVPYIPRTIF